MDQDTTYSCQNRDVFVLFESMTISSLPLCTSTLFPSRSFLCPCPVLLAVVSNTRSGKASLHFYVLFLQISITDGIFAGHFLEPIHYQDKPKEERAVKTNPMTETEERINEQAEISCPPGWDLLRAGSR